MKSIDITTNEWWNFKNRRKKGKRDFPVACFHTDFSKLWTSGKFKYRQIILCRIPITKGESK